MRKAVAINDDDCSSDKDGKIKKGHKKNESEPFRVSNTYSHNVHPFIVNGIKLQENEKK
jgi:hypothetical protein